MEYYLDIKILPDPEFQATVLMNALYSKFHKTLCERHSKNIGISFPSYQVTLGNVLRLHGSSIELDKLQLGEWLGGTKGYCHISKAKPVPENCQYRIVSRKQTTMSNSKLERLIKRGSITPEEAKQYKAKMFTKGLDNPYVELTSGSNGQRHRRYIQFGELLDHPIEGEFDQFGLSKTATIPWF